MATRWYRSPELVVTNKYSFPVDIWSVGCIIGELLDGEPMFPGDDALDQLYKIYGVVGPLDKKISKNMEIMFGSSSQKLMFNKSRRSGVRDICKKKLKKRYDKKINDKALDLMTRLLDNNPDTRPTAKEALNHPWFADLLEKEPELKTKIQETVKTKDITVERILSDLASKEQEMRKSSNKYSIKKSELYKNLPLELKNKKVTNCSSKNEGYSGRDTGRSRGGVHNKKQSYSVGKKALGDYSGLDRQGKENKFRKNLEFKSRILLQQKIDQQNCLGSINEDKGFGINQRYLLFF